MYLWLDAMLLTLRYLVKIVTEFDDVKETKCLEE